MARQKVASKKATALLEPLSPRKLRTRKGATTSSLANEGTSLPYLYKIKEAAKLAHKHAKKTRNNYNGYVARGIKWLEGHFAPDSTEGPGMEPKGGSIKGSPSQLKGAGSDEMYEDPEFRRAFDPIPNHCSDKALALFISWKCFHQNCGKSTSDGIYSAFKKYWEES
jgi:hypothetical protein